MSPDPAAKHPRAALITGGARRIGRAIALTLARAGYDVAVHVRRSRRDGEALAAEIAALGRRAAVVTADLAEHAEVARLVPQAVAALGPLTLLVNNASEFESDGIGRLDPARFDRHFAVNLRAPLFLSEAFAAQVPDGIDCSIVNLTDQRVRKLTPQFLTYTLTKSALETATVTLAQALAPRIRVNAVAPGPTLASPRQDAAAFARQAAVLPLGHGPKPEDVAAAVLYFATATSVTGETIAVDGGQHLAWQTADASGISE
ncbi:MAG TPA: SDR family oxidoreductase [Xanthobacteraceae bacterium]|jgi:NAD(P)-dependent dehydrogenase (short-subunit alcohol dehydrogenase family)|nr:SDR family oxidoreductase [Xanthobacteraceae bacterium]